MPRGLHEDEERFLSAARARRRSPVVIAGAVGLLLLLLGPVTAAALDWPWVVLEVVRLVLV